jgi:transcriptional regulator with XRE-family HTH domain
MNITETAQALGCSVATVSRICSGDRHPSLELMAEIRRVLRWSIEAQADEVRAGTYAATFKDKMERRQARGRDVDSQAVRGVQGSGSSGDGMPALEADGEDGEAGRLGQGAGKIDFKLDISDRWYPR